MTGWRTRAALIRLRRALRRRDVPRRRRREIAAEIRANLDAAAADFGEREALRRLGSLDALAAAYADGPDTAGLLVDAGVRAAVVAVAVLVALTLIRVPTFNTIETFDRHTGATTWSWEVWRLWHFGGDARTDTLFEATIYSTAFLLLPALAFAIWSRPWRLLQNTRSRTTDRPPAAFPQ